jgi:alanine racemase
VIHTPLRLRIDGDALVGNWRWLAAKGGGVACGAAVKADGYGVGAREAVARLAAAGCRDFFVATWAEAEALMPWPKDLSFSVLHGVGPDDMTAALALPARPVLNTSAQAARWREGAGGRPCDLMIDTGMNRLGMSAGDAGAVIAEGLAVETLMSHLACADEPGHPMNGRQLGAFEAIRRSMKAERYSLANSAGICLGQAYAFDLTRPGLALYGGVPVPDNAEQNHAISPVVRIEAQLVQLRDIEAGESVGYGATYVASSPRRVGVLNIGYADGYLRSLGPAGTVRSGGAIFPLIGRVSMDLIAIDLTEDQTNVEEGTWFEVDFCLPDHARQSGLSQYELLTGLGHRFERHWT